MNVRKFALILLIALPSIGISQNTNNNTGLEYFLKQFYDFSSLPKYEPNSYCAEVSTYDRTGLNNDGFNGTYSFLRRNEDSSLVIFEQDGAGVIDRIWTPTPSTDTLDFYIDDSLQKAFSICYMDLFSGKVYPFVAPLCSNELGGYYSYLPIPFSKFCKIVLKANKTQFHQIGYRLYDSSTHIKSFGLSLNDEEKEMLKKITTVWKEPFDVLKNTGVDFTEIKQKFIIKPGESITVFHAASAGRIAGFEIVSQSTLDAVAKNIDLRITWDNEKSPAVYCPLADYFGYAFGNASMQGLMVGSDGETHYSWFPMPYDKSAKIELIYRNVTKKDPLNDIAFTVKVFVQNIKRDTATEGKFYASWNHENPVATGKPYTMLDVKGKGHFAGVVLQAQGLKPGMTLFFEGDDSTVIDGQMRYHGTGSEDFFNGGWYALLDRWNDAMSLPLSGSLCYSTALARTGGYRYFLTDKMSFNHSLLQTIEHGPEHNLFPSDYTSVSYYYCDRNNAQKIIPLNSNTKNFMPDTLVFYPQITPSAMDGNISVYAKWDGPAKKMFYTISSESLLKFYFQDLPSGNYTVYLECDKENDAAKFSVWQRQKQISDWIDAFAPTTEKFQMQRAGVVNIDVMNQTISLKFQTTGERNKFILSSIVFVRN